MRDFVLRVGDTASPLESVLVDDAGDPVDLTGATVELALAPASGGTLVVDDELAEVVAPTNGGRVRFPAAGDPWPAAVTSSPRILLGRWLVTYGDGREQRFPNEGYLEVLVTADVGAVDVDDLLELDPALEADEAARVLKLARRAVRAHLYPTVLAEPWPDPVELVVLRHALRVAGAVPPSSAAGAVVSESLGSYSYRLDRPARLDDVLALADDLQRELEPWAPGRRRAYSVRTPSTSTVWPVDWWQRNLDNLDDEPAVPLP